MRNTNSGSILYYSFSNICWRLYNLQVISHSLSSSNFNLIHNLESVANEEMKAHSLTAGPKSSQYPMTDWKLTPRTSKSKYSSPHLQVTPQWRSVESYYIDFWCLLMNHSFPKSVLPSPRGLFKMESIKYKDITRFDYTLMLQKTTLIAFSIHINSFFSHAVLLWLFHNSSAFSLHSRWILHTVWVSYFENWNNLRSTHLDIYFFTSPCFYLFKKKRYNWYSTLVSCTNNDSMFVYFAEWSPHYKMITHFITGNF